MSKDEQAAVIGQMVIRYGEAKKQSLLVEAELRRIAEVFKAVSSALSVQPSRVSTKGKALLMGKGYGEPEKIDGAVFDFDKLARLLDEHAELRATIAKLEPKLRELGVVTDTYKV